MTAMTTASVALMSQCNRVRAVHEAHKTERQRDDALRLNEERFSPFRALRSARPLSTTPSPAAATVIVAPLCNASNLVCVLATADRGALPHFRHDAMSRCKRQSSQQAAGEIAIERGQRRFLRGMFGRSVTNGDRDSGRVAAWGDTACVDDDALIEAAAADAAAAVSAIDMGGWVG